MSNRSMINAFMAGLVELAGGVEQASRSIDARQGIPLENGNSTRKGTISKRLAGHLDWTLVDILALEEVTCDHRVSDWISQCRAKVADDPCLMQAMSETYRETGEAMSALTDLVAGRGCRNKAKTEISQAQAALSRLSAAVDGSDGTEVYGA